MPGIDKIDALKVL